MSAEALLGLILSKGINLVVLTGGEPTIQDSASMYELVQGLTNKGLIIDVETNGSNLGLTWLAYIRNVVVSPKMQINLTPCSFSNLYFKLLVEDFRLKNVQCEVVNYINQNKVYYYLSVIAPVPFSLREYVFKINELVDYLKKNKHIYTENLINSLPLDKAIINIQVHKLLWNDSRRR
jgi:organic radical activating enzyme